MLSSPTGSNIFRRRHSFPRCLIAVYGQHRPHDQSVLRSPSLPLIMHHIWRLEFQDFRTHDSVVLCASHEVPMKSECGLDSLVSSLYRVAFGGIRGRGMPDFGDLHFGFMFTQEHDPVRADLSQVDVR